MGGIESILLTDRWVEESDLGSSYKGYTGYREVLGGKDDIGGPNQANFEALAFILWCLNPFLGDLRVW